MNTREFCKEPRSAGSCFGEIQGADLDGDDDDDDEAPMVRPHRIAHCASRLKLIFCYSLDQFLHP